LTTCGTKQVVPDTALLEHSFVIAQNTSRQGRDAGRDLTLTGTLPPGCDTVSHKNGHSVR
jgi:hypothetical protein